MKKINETLQIFLQFHKMRKEISFSAKLLKHKTARFNATFIIYDLITSGFWNTGIQHVRTNDKSNFLIWALFSYLKSIPKTFL